MVIEDDFDFDDGLPAAGNGFRHSRPVPMAPIGKPPVRRGEAEAENLAAPVRLLGLDIVGFKRIRAVQFELSATGITTIGGGNAAGKSSCLEAVTCLLGGGRYVPDVPVHGGDPRAEIVAMLSDANGRKYRIRRIINPDRTGGLEISREDGTTVSRAQEFLDAMKGVLWFDPPAFLRQPGKEQAETLRRLVGLDFSAMDLQRAQIYEQRTLIGRDRDRAKGHAESLPYHQDAPEEEQTSSELATAMQEAVAHNADVAAKQGKLQQARAHLQALARERGRLNSQAEDLRTRIAALQEQLERCEAEDAEVGAKVEAFVPNMEAFESKVAVLQPVDVEAIAARLTDVEQINRKVRQNADRAKAFAQANQYGAEWDHLSEAIAGIDADKRRQLSEVAMPVHGLAFDEAGASVLYQGYPLSQASGAEQMRVAVAMAMLMSGGLKTCLIDEGEKMDLTQLALLDESVRSLDGQCLMARVSDGAECDLIIEDGAVREAVTA